MDSDYVDFANRGVALTRVLGLMESSAAMGFRIVGFLPPQSCRHWLRLEYMRMNDPALDSWWLAEEQNRLSRGEICRLNGMGQCEGWNAFARASRVCYQCVYYDADCRLQWQVKVAIRRRVLDGVYMRVSRWSFNS